MEPSGVADLLQQGLLAGAFLAFPLLLSAAAIGLVFAIVQATMQIQDSSLQQAVKIIVAGGIIYLFGHILSAPLVSFTARLFQFSP